jgi:hypothetical protein
MKTRRWLAAILAVSFALRLWLSELGGQDFWPDESRYTSARMAAQDLAAGHSRDALVDLFGHADHVLFRPACLPVALLENWIGGIHPLLVSAYLSLFSVGVIWLVWAVARRAGAPESEALWAAFLAAAANSLFLYSRFYLPYDVALFALMGALWLALGRASPTISILTGVVAGLGFLAYNGYWLLCAAVLILHTFLGAGGWRRIAVRGACSALGLILVVAAVVGIGAALRHDLAAEYGGFAGSVKQGDFHVGYRVMLEYLWYTERGMALVGLAAFTYAVLAGFPGGLAGRLGWWLGGVAIVAAGLVFFSDVVPIFMVYGRLTRSAVPFACLGAAQGIDSFVGARGPARGRWATTVAILVALLASWNFSASLRLVFPLKFQTIANRKIQAGTGAGYRFHRVLFAEMLWGRPLHYDLPPAREILRSAHPMQFRPYQYEGYSAAQREQMNSLDIAMRLVEFDTGFRARASEWEGYPGPVRLKVAFGSENWNQSEPLVVSGATGVGDVLFVRFLDSAHIAFGLDHWSSALLLSDPVKLDLSKPHELLISAGTLLPPPGSDLYKKWPELSRLRNYVLVVLDGRLVFTRHAEFYPSAPQTIYFGSNVIGGSATNAQFTGTVSEFGPAPIGQIVRFSPPGMIAEIASHRPPEWAGAVGPLHLRFALPAPGDAVFVGQPLLTIGGPVSSDVLFVERDSDQKIRIGYDSRGHKRLRSDPVERSESGVEEMDVSIGSMLPAATAPLYSQVPGFTRWRSRIEIRLNGQLVLLEERPFEPVDARWMCLAENTVASSVCGAYFQGSMEQAGAWDPEKIPLFASRLSDLLTNPDASWDGFVGPLKLRLKFPTDRAGQAEPLLVSGAPGAADSFFVRYDDDSHVRFGFEHSGADPVLSMPVAIRPGATQEVLLSAGALMPPQGSTAYLGAEELLLLRSLAEVAFNGHPVIFELQKPHPSIASQVEIGANLLGRATCGPRFNGEIVALRIAKPLEALCEGAVDPRLAREGWDGYPGPLRMRIVVPRARPGFGQPIVTTGFPGGGDFIFMSYEPDGKVRINQDHWGSPLAQSEPIVLEPGSEHEFSVSFGALYPPEDAPLYRRHPELLGLRSRVIVSIDGRTVLSAVQLSHPTPPGRIIVGANFIGGSYAASLFTGSITELAHAPLEPFTP